MKTVLQLLDKVKLNKVELLINNQPYRDYLLTYSNLILLLSIGWC